MEIRLIPCEQGKPEWFQARAGIVTASEFSKVLAKGEGLTRAKYMRQLAGEIITGQPCDSEFEGNKHTERGKLLEPEARELLQIRTGKTIHQVGFIRNDTLRMGCSPDGLQGYSPDNPDLLANMEMSNGVEVKCCIPDIQIERLMRGGVPSNYRAQIEGSLLVTGAPSWTFYSYASKLPPLIVETELTPARRAVLLDELVAFNAELDLLVAEVKNKY